MLIGRVLVPVTAVLVVSCGGSSASSNAPEEFASNSSDLTLVRTTYAEIFDYLTGSAQFDTYLSVVQTLNQNFADICGDTYCGGDYSNLTPLQFTCSVTEKTGTIEKCMYIFAGSYSTVSKSTGKLTINSKTFNCPIPVTGKASDLITLLSAAGTTEPLNRPLPGSNMSIYDSLGTCL
jgi:hypothetical protein